MRRVLYWIAVAAALVPPAVLAHGTETAMDGPTIRVVGDGWGNARPDDIAAVLRSVADVLLPAPAPRPNLSIVVSHGPRAPMVLYERDADGAYRVMLHAHDDQWHLYVYEFAHEYCHILSNYDEYGADVSRRNQWFEESLCETASLFALNAAAARWQMEPPAPGLAGAERKLSWFRDLLMAEPHRRVPAEGVAAWLKDHEDKLRQDPYQRAMNELVATHMLPAFAVDGGWSALRSLNRSPDDSACSLRELVDHWYRNADSIGKTSVARIRTLLFEEAPVASSAIATVR
ncbi:MAG TPA: hypothetical protein VMC81_02930 [Rhodocyclaceae bacterium]|nr:hypothetical protein [Rhodocyclaceae bacterium]